MARVANTGPMKDQAARQMRRTAAMLDQDHPETVAGDHLRDAAKMLDRGQLDSTKRHLDAAMEVLTPRNLYRHGITDDEGHATAKHHMHQVHRHRLAVQDIEDTRGSNDRLRGMARAARGQPEPMQPFHRPPPQLPDGQQAVAAANRHGNVIELTGLKGYSHGWVFHGVQGSAGHYDAVLGHAALDRIDRQSHASITQHLSRAKGAAAGGDHTTAEMHLTDARRKATRLGEADLASAIGTLHDYHRRQATEAIGVKPNITQGQISRVIKREQARPRPAPRVVPPRGYQPSFILANQRRRMIELAFSPAERRGPGGQWTGGKGSVFGKRLSKGEARGFAGMLGAGGHQHGGTSKKSELAGLSKSQRKVYDKLHKRGVKHDKALRAAQTPPADFGKSLSRVMAHQHAGTSAGVELSARTPMLERTPAPRGRPGGPGLYDVKGMGHTAYYQQVVKALIEKRGMPPGKAYAIARGAIRKWMRGGGHVHPEVQAAAAGAEAGEIARQGRAKASHGHASGWDVADALVELACDGSNVIDLFNPNHSPTGQFTTASGAGAGQGKGSKAQQRARLTKQIAGLRSRIAALRAQLPSHTSSGPRSKSSTPRKTGAGAKSAKQAKAGKTASGKAASGVSSRTRSPSAIRAQITILRGQLRLDVAALKRLK